MEDQGEKFASNFNHLNEAVIMFYSFFLKHDEAGIENIYRTGLLFRLRLLQLFLFVSGFEIVGLMSIRLYQELILVILCSNGSIEC